MGPMDRTVLVVDDRATPRRLLASELAEAGFRVLEAADGRDAWARFRAEPPDLVITDLVMPRSDGIELVGRIRAHSRVPVIVFTAHGSVDAAVAALKSGADEFVASSDVDVDDLVALADRFLVRPATRDVAAALAERLVGESPALRRVRERVAGLASLREPVLVSGEPGSGRDTVARALHDLAPRARGPFVVLPPERADAPDALPGGGTVYLDEVERFSPDAQRRFADELARGSAGGSAGPRFVASSGPGLGARMAEGAFDRDLGARLLRFEVALPPLRERPEDVPRLARLLLERAGRALGRPGMRFETRALERLRREHWPGNVAELTGIVEKLVGFATGLAIGRQEVDEVLAEFRLSVASLRERAACEERRRVVEALRETGGNVTRAAERLGRSRAALYRLVEKHGLPLRREF
jgi:DNA-binding NtrC family response regulator